MNRLVPRRSPKLGLGLLLGLALACTPDKPSPTKAAPEALATEPEPSATTAKPTGAADEAEDEAEGALVGEAAHVIPFADRTSMGYLLLFPPGTAQPEAPTREQLQTLVRQAFPDRRRDGEIDLLLTLIETEPHATDYIGEIDAPAADDTGGGGEGPGEGATGSEAAGQPVEVDDAALREIAAKRERERSFDLIGLHIEVLHLGIGDDATIPSAALQDRILTRGLTDAERKTALGRSWALLLRADYRNKHAVRGLRLLQTLVRVAAEHYGAIIHDPDTLETMNVTTFAARRLRAEAGNVADQLAIVPFPDPRNDDHLRLSTRGMRRFGAVDIELDGLPRDPVLLQQASDLIAGLALALVKEGELDTTGFAVEVPQVIEVDGELVRHSYADREVTPAVCPSCQVSVHLVERAPDDYDPIDHVVARIVAPRERSDAPDYDHPQWVRTTLGRLFATAGSASPQP